MRRSYIIRKHPVCANDDICLSVLDIYQIGLDLRRIDKARQQNHVDREAFAPLDKILVMLLGEQRRGREHNSLRSVRRRLGHGAECNFRRAEADIPAEQPVHRLLRLHIRFYLFYSAKLIFRLNKRESLLELLLVLIVGQTCKSRIYTSLSVQLKQIERDFLYGFLRTGDRLLPLIAAEPRQLWRAVSRPDILLQRVNIFRENI